MGEMVLLMCTIEAGPSSGERAFRFRMGDGVEYSGVAPAHHFRGRGHGRPLLRDEPARGRDMEGYVEVYRLHGEEAGSRVRLPGGEVVTVSSLAVPFKSKARHIVQYEPT